MFAFLDLKDLKIQLCLSLTDCHSHCTVIRFLAQGGNRSVSIVEIDEMSVLQCWGHLKENIKDHSSITFSIFDSLLDPHPYQLYGHYILAYPPYPHSGYVFNGP